MRCPDCRGRGLIRALVDGTGIHRSVSMPCMRCKGAGAIDPEQERWINLGGIHRTWRVAQLESLGVCAGRLGIKVTELSAMEAGRSNPDQLLTDIPAMLRPMVKL